MFRFWKRKPRTLVLGQQLADARKAERERVASEATLPFFEDASKRADPQVAEMLRKQGRQSLAGKKLSDLSFLEEVSTKYGPGFVSGEAAVRSASEGAPAGASVSGCLRPEFRPQEEGHSVLGFLVECVDKARASRLEGFARNADHSSHAVIGRAEGRLFCIVVGHSMMHGVSPIETICTLSVAIRSIQSYSGSNQDSSVRDQ